MIKTQGSHFKLNKTAKRLLATIVDAHQCGHVRRMEISAQKSIEAARNSRFKKDGDKEVAKK